MTTNNKQTLKYGAFFSILILIIFLSTKILNNISSRNTYNSKIENAPLDSNFNWIYHYKFLQKNNLLIVLFHPECEHCQNLAKNIHKNSNSFKNTDIWFISFVTKKEAKQFQLKYFNKNKTSTKFGIIPLEEIDNFFFDNTIPQIHIYDKNKKLKIRFNGEPQLNDILKNLD